MKKRKFTEAQFIFALKQSEAGVKVEEVCRKKGISKTTQRLLLLLALKYLVKKKRKRTI